MQGHACLGIIIILSYHTEVNFIVSMDDVTDTHAVLD